MEEINLQLLLFLLCAGFLAAFVDSVVGGGGLIAIPALLFAGLPPAMALGTNKLASSMSSLTSTISFMRAGKIHFGMVKMLIPLSLIGSLSGAFIMRQVPSDFLKPLIILLLLLVTLYTFFKKNWGAESTYTGMTLKKGLLIALAALVIGFYDGFFGAGTGSFLMFSFLTLGFNFVEAAGNAKVLNFASNFAAVVMFVYLDAINYAYGLPMGVAMVLGALLGSKLAISKGTSYVKALFVSVSILMISKQCWDYFSV
ncbi:hypothetical protein SAMN05444487_1034 [Marininema mesophilum]|uniref:Probable membrane transporter protein n=1 Tax=Marininema mesophilum TaxID=1048340 RepID=A0A1H2T3X0_9BACL|nr:TSUP family transporter [Marininema mesophilum]SDW37979.1 hypothetical protein SAMN05444487_1034 [Marininema mesophilum]